jgi:hypothetical protein
MMRRWRWLVLVALLVAGALPASVGPVLAAPSLDLSVWRGPCDVPVVARGTEFTPGLLVRFTVRAEEGPGEELPVAEMAVGDDGTVSVTVDLTKYFPGCDMPSQVARQYRISARDAATESLLAYAIYIVDAEAAPTATLTLDPESGPCAVADPPIVARGTNFPPGVTVLLDVRAATGAATTFPAGVVAADGTIVGNVRLVGCGPNTPLGTTFSVVAYSNDIPGAEPQTLLATAIFTVAAPTNEQLCFPQTGKCVAGRFLSQWRATGGLPINGYPLSEVFTETLEDGKQYQVQYFERVRMEYHPENQPPFDVLLGQFGRRILAGIPDAPTAPVSPRDGSIFFTETGHNVDADIFAFWLVNGGLPQFGYPLTEEFVQRLEDNQLYVVQYFERARIERHPENEVPYKLQLGQFGRVICGQACK